MIIVGKITKVIFYDKNTNYGIYKIDRDVVGIFSGKEILVSKVNQYQFIGSWQRNKKHGKYFKIKEYKSCFAKNHNQQIGKRDHHQKM